MGILSLCPYTPTGYSNTEDGTPIIHCTQDCGIYEMTSQL